MFVMLLMAVGPLLVGVFVTLAWVAHHVDGATAGVVIQSLAVIPLLGPLREHLAMFLHDLTDWKHGDGPGKEQTRLYRMFIFLRGEKARPGLERVLRSFFNSVTVLASISYIVWGAWLQAWSK